MSSEWRNPKHDLQEESKVTIEQALVLAVALVMFGFLTFRSFEMQAYEGSGEMNIIDIEQIPETEQLKKPPPPQRPQMPVATESEDIPEDVTIMDTGLDLNAPPPPPPPPPGAGRGRGEESPIFLSWEEAPELLKMVLPVYPEIAHKAGVEGYVIVQMVVDENGDVLEAKVVVASPPGIFEEAAIAAVMQWKFKPARQRDKPIKVRMGQRVNFMLTNRRPPPPP